MFSFDRILALEAETQAEFVSFPSLSREETPCLEYYCCQLKYDEMKPFDDKADDWAM